MNNKQAENDRPCPTISSATIDFGTKEVRLVTYAMLSGDVEADLARIREAYRTLRPEA